MSFFDNRGLAIAIAAVTVVGSTLISGGVGLSNACQKTENAFYSVDEGRAPYYYVNQEISTAASLLTVAKHYNSEELDAAATELKQARNDLSDAYSGKSIHGMHDAMEAIHTAMQHFDDAIGTVDLSSEDLATYADCSSAMDGAYRNVSKSTYNENAESFMKNTYNTFPASAFASLMNIDPPELYA